MTTYNFAITIPNWAIYILVAYYTISLPIQIYAIVLSNRKLKLKEKLNE